NPENGFPVSIMDATDITAFRTGAAGGVAAKYLAKDDPETFGFVGAGRQAKTQLLALNEIYGIKELKVYDPDKNSLLSFERFATKLKIKTDIVTKIESAVKGMDVLTTTTPVSIPVIKSDWVSQGTHINAIGADAPGKQELDALLLKRARIFVDDMEQAYHGGEVNVPLSQGIIRKKDISGELGEVIAGSKPGRKNNKEITIFDSTGLALQDVPCAHFVYNQAGKKSIGRKINLIDF
ncbi:MAG: ornithine cyclodeaminase family protein, partial [Elusimicrobiota bacterium]